MARTHSSIATDSEEALRSVVGPDATATTEADPTFIDANLNATASSDNVAVQRDTDDTEDSEEEVTEAGDEDLDEQDEDDELDDEEDDEDDEDDDEDEEEAEEEEEAVATFQTRTFEDLGQEDDDDGDVDRGLDDEDGAEDDELDTDRITDAALSLDPILRMAAAMRMAPSTSVRASSNH